MEFKKSLLPAAVAAVVYAGCYSSSALATVVPVDGIVVKEGETHSQDGEEGALRTTMPVKGNIVNNGTVKGGSEEGIDISAALTGNIINNAGATITGSDGIDISGAGMTGTVINHSGATIQGETGIRIDASNAAIREPEHDPEQDVVAISNAGLIEATGAFDEEEDEGDAILVQSHVSEEIVNLEGGIIRSLHGNGIRIDASKDDSMNDDIVNAGLIEGKLAGINIDSGEINGFIENAATGQIIGGESGIDVSGDGLEGIVNAGLIQGEDGIFIDGNGENLVEYAIENSGTIRATSETGAAIYSEDTIGHRFGDPKADDGETFGLVNQQGGVIENTSTSASATAIHLADDAKIRGEFLNRGTIRGVFAVKTDDSVAALELDNSQEGLIEGKVVGKNLTLDNAGTFRTEQGSQFAHYEGSGSIVAILSDATKADEAVISVTGTAELEAGSKVLVEGKKDDFTATVAGNVYTILEADTLTVADGEELAVESNSVLLKVTLESLGTNRVTVLVKANDAGQVIGDIGASEEEKEIISTFQKEVIADIPESDPVFQMFESASSSPEALVKLAQDLQPETSGADAAGASAAQSATFGSVGARTSSIRSGANSGDIFQSGGVWGQLLHSKGTQKDRAQSSGFTSRITGLTIGTDGELTPEWTLGAALTTAKGTTNTKGSSNSTDSSSVIGTVYANWQSNSWFTDVMVSFGRTTNKGERLNKLIKSDYDANQYGLRLSAGKDIVFENADVIIQPTLGFNYGRVDIESYKEKGSLAALEMQAQRYETIELGAGVKAIKSFDMDNGVIRASVNLSGWHDFAADQVKTQSRFLTGGTIITSTGDKPEKTTWQAGTGIDYLAGNHLTFSLDYDHTWKKSFKADSVSAKLRYDF